MKPVSELDLPTFDYAAPDMFADRYHEQLADTRRHGWLARSPLGGVEGIYGVDKLPISWSAPPGTSPSHGREPDLT